jgi:hypothetical protein
MGVDAMLGENVGETRGQTIGTRILPDEGQGPRMEVTDRAVGMLYGVHVNTTVTYIGVMRPNGTIAGTGTGTLITEDGEMATYRGAGVGRVTRPGVMSWRGALFHETTSAKLARLNGIAVLFEYEIDESGKSEGHFHEWK